MNTLSINALQKSRESGFRHQTVSDFQIFDSQGSWEMQNISKIAVFYSKVSVFALSHGTNAVG